MHLESENCKNSLREEFLNLACKFERGKLLGYDPEAILLRPAVLSQAGRSLWLATKHLNYRCLLAPGSGSGPLATSIMLAAYAEGISLDIIQVKDPQRYPERKSMICGPAIQTESRALFVDDCLLMGGSFRKTKKLIKTAVPSLQIVACAVLYDAQQLAGSRQITAAGITVHSLVKRRDLGLTRDAQHKDSILGRRIWQRVGFELKRSRSCAPVISEGLVLVGDDSCALWAFDIDTGEEKWKILPLKVHDKGINNDLTVHDGAVYFSTYGGELCAAKVSTGKILWRIKADMACHSAPAIDAENRCLYLNCESPSNTGHIRCFDLHSGALKWSCKHEGFAPSQPSFDEAHVYSTANDQTLCAVNKKSGRLIWREKTSGLVRGATCVDELGVYVVTEKGYFQCFDRITGERILSSPYSNSSNHVFPVKFGQEIITSDKKGLAYALSPRDGRKKWVTRLRGAASWRPAKLDSNHILFITDAGNIAVVNFLGIKLFEQRTTMRGFAPPAVVENRIIFFTLDGDLICFEFSEFVSKFINLA
jgi:outer membrane protein assembly factor BamB/orotate phosphoribosyltransferase